MFVPQLMVKYATSTRNSKEGGGKEAMKFVQLLRAPLCPNKCPPVSVSPLTLGISMRICATRERILFFLLLPQFLCLPNSSPFHTNNRPLFPTIQFSPPPLVLIVLLLIRSAVPFFFFNSSSPTFFIILFSYCIGAF